MFRKVLLLSANRQAIQCGHYNAIYSNNRLLSSLLSQKEKSKNNDKFVSWFVKEVKDEKNRLQLANFLNSLYEANIVPLQSLDNNRPHDYYHKFEHFNEFLDNRNITTFLNNCLDGNTIVHENVLYESIIKCESLLHEKHNVSVIPASVEKVIVVGDLHGDLASLNHIYKTIGEPNNKQAYVFNGDIVDRGNRSSEVLFVILSLLQKYPTRVFINRGNHEDTFMNKAYGFKNELYTKYGVPNGRVLMNSLSRLYASLPICTFSPKFKLFISHGGPPLLNNTNEELVDISKINRKNCKRTTDNKLLENILWSDPDIELFGLQRNESRGAGIVYGIDTLEKWMKNNDINIFIRSHQCVQFGYEKLTLNNNNKHCYTVFSSANYRGSGNEGAYLIISNDNIECNKFHSDDIKNDKTIIDTNNNPHCNDNYSKEVIISIFRAIDLNGNGYLTYNEIEKALLLIKDFKLTNNVDHCCFIGDKDKYLNIQQLFNTMDKDGNGQVSINEFIETFISLTKTDL